MTVAATYSAGCASQIAERTLLATACIRAFSTGQVGTSGPAAGGSGTRE